MEKRTVTTIDNNDNRNKGNNSRNRKLRKIKEEGFFSFSQISKKNLAWLAGKGGERSQIVLRNFPGNILCLLINDLVILVYIC